MAQILTVFPDQPAVRQSVTLGGAQYDLRLTWRSRPAAWYADLWAADGTPVWLGQRVSPGWPLGGGSQPANRPSGTLLVRGPADYQRDDLGSSVQLVYYTPDELPAAVVADDAVTITIP